MGLRQEIIEALSRPFDAEAQGLDKTKYFGLSVWHNGATLEESWITISTEYNGDTGTLTKDGRWIPTFDLSGETQIDIFDKKGTGKGELADINRLKKKFKEIYRILPPGEYQMNANHPTKARLYAREFLKDPWFSMSGITSRGSGLSDEEKTKLKKKGVPLEYETMVMNVPEDAARIGTGKSSTGKYLGFVPDEVVNKEFNRYIQDKYQKTGKRVESNSFLYNGRRYGFSDAGDNRRSLMHDGKGFKLYRSGDKQTNEAARRLRKEKLTPDMDIHEWLRIRDIYRMAADKGLEVDHIQPIHLGGPHHPDNLQLLTKSANDRKGTSWTKGGTNFANEAIPFEPQIGPATLKDYKWAKNKATKSVLKNIDGLSRYGSKADAFAHLGFSAASGDVFGTAAAVPGVVLNTSLGRKGFYKAMQKFGSKRLTNLLPGVSIAGNTADVVRYTTQGRGIQAGVAGLAGVLDEMQNPLSEAGATALQFGNTLTDYFRGDYSKDYNADDPDVSKRTLNNIGFETNTNWRSYSNVLRNL
tara:strand:- start:660 stop:2243 length:1584 start_codon:yes stop_codon:yes gene_type:complete